MRLRHHRRYHSAIHNMTKVIELVEDMRPFVHIFFANIAPPVAVMCGIAAIVGIFRYAHH
jgi:hypothetical protein